MRYIGVAGDWHGNTRWAISQSEAMITLLRQFGEEHPLILHAGDFGIWPGKSGVAYLETLNLVLALKDASLYFIDGNHEDFSQLMRIQELNELNEEEPPWNVMGCIYWLPRGHRWEWHGKTWLALGGAASIDRAARTPMTEWWPEESITYRQAAHACIPGPVDVMLTHEAPMGVPLQLYNAVGVWPDSDIRSTDSQRQLLAGVVNEVEPAYLIHGHHHQGSAKWNRVKFPHGEMDVTSLNCDGVDGNWGILDVQEMKWVG